MAAIFGHKQFKTVVGLHLYPTSARKDTLNETDHKYGV